MTFRQGFSLGIRSYSKAYRFLKEHRLTWYFIFPLLLNIFLFIVGYSSTASLASNGYAHLNEWMQTESWTFWGAGFISTVIEFLMHVIVRILFFILFAYVGGYIVVILLSPIFALLSEKVESIITGNNYPFNAKQFFKDIWRGVLLAIRNLGIELLLTIILFIVSFVPVVGLFSAFALFVVSAYFYGFSFIDYSLERKRLSIHQSVVFVKTNRGIVIGNGTIFSLVLLIPYIGVLLSGFISIIAVTAATLATTEALNHKI